jgi:hypothetical protein
VRAGHASSRWWVCLCVAAITPSVARELFFNSPVCSRPTDTLCPLILPLLILP